MEPIDERQEWRWCVETRRAEREKWSPIPKRMLRGRDERPASRKRRTAIRRQPREVSWEIWPPIAA